MKELGKIFGTILPSAARGITPLLSAAPERHDAPFSIFDLAVPYDDVTVSQEYTNYDLEVQWHSKNNPTTPMSWPHHTHINTSRYHDTRLPLHAFHDPTTPKSRTRSYRKCTIWGLLSVISKPDYSKSLVEDRKFWAPSSNNLLLSNHVSLSHMNLAYAIAIEFTAAQWQSQITKIRRPEVPFSNFPLFATLVA